MILSNKRWGQKPVRTSGKRWNALLKWMEMMDSAGLYDRVDGQTLATKSLDFSGTRVDKSNGLSEKGNEVDISIELLKMRDADHDSKAPSDSNSMPGLETVLDLGDDDECGDTEAAGAGLPAEQGNPWFIGGDFNLVLSVSGRSYGVFLVHYSIEKFFKAIFDCGLVDVGASPASGRLGSLPTHNSGADSDSVDIVAIPISKHVVPAPQVYASSRGLLGSTGARVGYVTTQGKVGSVEAVADPSVENLMGMNQPTTLLQRQLGD
ncbi:hypothetical protein Salat_2519000 [Sesamum alatum]|uniref:Uncharacterized protein n=1 Tax=Sesamum alatum TaxID=300844 RepID=A0AAE1XS13_9LAMI|nr:hypothetical protein Salat_2519000 [Sesamum alatum]